MYDKETGVRIRRLGDYPVFVYLTITFLRPSEQNCYLADYVAPRNRAFLKMLFVALFDIMIIQCTGIQQVERRCGNFI